MEKTFTLNDLRHYLHEINRIEKGTRMKSPAMHGPSDLTLQNLLRYSSALNIMKTRSAGIIYHLVN
jgi:hypothetical protein